MSAKPEEIQPPDWFEPLYPKLGLDASSPLEEIYERADKVAYRLAVQTRQLWTCILVLEGVAVVLPLLWLIVIRHNWSPSYTAFAVLVCTIGIVGACWWLRWRGMQHTWAHSRLVAEIARSGLAVAKLPGNITCEALLGASSVQAMASRIIPADLPAGKRSLADIKSSYLKDRIEDQLKFFRGKQKGALAERKDLSKLVTRTLDGALFLAVAGAALVLTGRAPYLLTISGGSYIFALGGTVLPLVALLMQSRSFYLELNRRTGRYAQQIEFLESATVRLAQAKSIEDVSTIIRGVERVLLSEVAEWFYQAQYAELFYREPPRGQPATTAEEVTVCPPGWLTRLFRFGTAAAIFIASTIIGRLFVAVLAVAVTMAWIAFQDARNLRVSSQLHLADGELRSSADKTGWQPNPARTANGFVLIAHGLDDGVDLEEDPVKWMGNLQRAIEGRRLEKQQPNFCLVDWAKTAGGPAISNDILSRVGAIRPKAEKMGHLVGCNLAIAIRNKEIDPGKPMHFIGHSAGGFVIMSAVRTLLLLGIEPEKLHLTILDTPVPDDSEKGDLRLIEKSLPKAAIDYYCTSAFAQFVPRASLHQGFAGFTRFDISPDKGTDPFKGAHSFAYKWYIKSVADNDERGFHRSPFCPKP